MEWGILREFFIFFPSSLLLLLFCSFLCLALVSGDLCLGWAADSPALQLRRARVGVVWP